MSAPPPPPEPTPAAALTLSPMRPPRPPKPAPPPRVVSHRQEGDVWYPVWKRFPAWDGWWWCRPPGGRTEPVYVYGDDVPRQFPEGTLWWPLYVPGDPPSRVPFVED